MDKWIKHQLLATSDQNLIAFLSFLIPPCHFYFFLVSLLGGQEVIQIRLLGCLKVQFVPAWWHLSVQRCRLLQPQNSRDSCLLCRSIRTARFPRVRATNQIVISFTGLTQAASPKRQPVPREHIYSDKTYEATILWIHWISLLHQKEKWQNYTLGSGDPVSCWAWILVWFLPLIGWTTLGKCLTLFWSVFLSVNWEMMETRRRRWRFVICI